ncbi:MAG: MBL fold metallo-hydrolase [Candidatus Bipolaricaulaceae bacterium]
MGLKIRYIGHACFRIQTDSGMVIVTDPFDESVPYEFPRLQADIVTVSHEHFDHNAVDRVDGDPEVVRGLGEHAPRGISIWGIPSFHDAKGGRERGRNTIFRLQVDGVNLVHFGDLGHPLNAEQLKPLRETEVALLPVGGHFTIGPREAAELIRALPKLKVVIPMHAKTDVIKDWPIAPVDEFLAAADLPVERPQGPDVELTPEAIPTGKQVWVLPHA